MLTRTKGDTRRICTVVRAKSTCALLNEYNIHNVTMHDFVPKDTTVPDKLCLLLG